MPATPSPPPSPTPGSSLSKPPAAPTPSPLPAHGGQEARATMALAALGVVFGDIGTSPLYTLSECLGNGEAHKVLATPANVLGVLSLIFWSLMLVVTLKYMSFLMRADNHGEGGIMALLALVPERMRAAGPGTVNVVAALVVAGAALLFGDGIITPAISVLSAMEGLQVATQDLAPLVVPATVVILIGLFAIQKKGTGQIGALFGPVMLLWFGTAGALGLAQIIHHPMVLEALSPHHAIGFFAQNGWHAVRVLGGVVLAVTGGEALYADMGHFGRKPIRAAWLAVVLPGLVLCYFGQGAAILEDPSGAARPFYALVPHGPWIYAAVALASAATIIASQALISGVFSLTHQAVRLGFFPRLTIVHTSSETEGQIYVPLMNWGLAVACIALVLVFRESSRLAAAFGLAVSGTMLITSIVYFYVTRSTWGWPLWRAGGLLLLFLSFDIPFVVANSLKFFDGGYLPFLVGVAFVVIMVSWRTGRGHLSDCLKRQAMPVAPFLAELEAHLLGRTAGTQVVLASHSEGIPPVLYRQFKRFRVVSERVLILTVTTERVPHVPDDQRLELEALGGGLFRVVARYGFMESPDVPAMAARALASLGVEQEPGGVTYLLGRETLMNTPRGKMGRLTESVFTLLARNARSASDYFRIPPEQVIELGAQFDL